MKKIYSGSQILVKAALEAGCQYFAGYPITPATKILENFSTEADRGKTFNFLQVEDEIAAVHSIIGASLAGKKALTATSGPGFSLMQEGLGLAYATDVPVVIVNIMRQGPSTGMPTKPSQGDVMQTQYGSHGDHETMVYYPNSLKDIYKLTIEAFNTAEEVSAPVIILLDAALINLYETLEKDKQKVKTIKHNLVFGKSNRHLSGLVTDEDGVPQTNDFSVYKKWQKNRKGKLHEVSQKHDLYEYHKNSNSKNLLISYGALSRQIPYLNNVDKFIPKKLFPISEKLMKISQDYKKVIVIEMNDGQYANAVSSDLGRKVEKIQALGEDLFPERLKHLINEKI